MGSPRDFTLVFAGAATQEIKARGRFIRILEAPQSNVWVEIDGGSELKRVAGQGVNFGNDAMFDRFRIRSAVAQTVLVNVSDERQDDDQTNVTGTVTANVDPANTLDVGGDVNILTLASTTVAASDLTRRAVIIEHLGTVAMRIGGVGVGATSGKPLAPGESLAIATTDAVAVYNPHTGTQSVSVLPIREV